MDCVDCFGSGVTTRGGQDVRCPECLGVGTTPWCSACGGHGRYRAQLCISVVNVVTGEVASRLLEAGHLPVEPWVENRSRRVVDVGQVVAGLADEVGATDLVHPVLGSVPTAPGEDVIVMPPQWRDDAPLDQRRAWQVHAFADYVGLRRWRIVVGYPPGWGPGPELGVEARWRALRDFASAACLDLVVRRVDGRWTVRYEVPDAELKEGFGGEGYLVSADLDLASAVEQASPGWLLARMAALRAPGYGVRPTDVPDDETTGWSTDDLTEALDALADPCDPVIAIWRDRRWHLRRATPSFDAVGLTVPVEPVPAPSWRRRRLHEAPCDCERDETGRCRTCRGTGWRRDGAVVTLALSGDRVVVRTLVAGARTKLTVQQALLRTRRRGWLGQQRWEDREPTVTLPREMTLEHVLDDVGVASHVVRRPSSDQRFRGPLLTADTRLVSDDQRVGRRLRPPQPDADGRAQGEWARMVVHISEGLIGDYMAELADGMPGGRAFFVVEPGSGGTSLGWFCALARALGIRLDITVDPTVSPSLWGLELSSGAQEPEGWPPALRPLGELIAETLQELPLLLTVHDDIPPDRQLSAPRQLGPSSTDDDLDLAERVERWAGSERAWVAMTPEGWVVHRIEQLRPHGLRLGGQARGTTLAEALGRPLEDL